VIDSSSETNDPGTTTPDFPWPPRENDSVFAALGATWKDSVFHPTSFFRRMPREFDLGWVLGYYLIIGVANAGFALFWHMVLGPSWWQRTLATRGGPPANPAIEFLLSPVMLLLGLLLAAGIVHLFLLLFRGNKHGFETTVRVFCFSSGPQLFAVIPIIGALVGGVWTLVLTVIGLREAHDTSTGRVIAAIGVPILLLTGLLVLLLIAGFLLGAASLGT
jgi:hypothetical protein